MSMIDTAAPSAQRRAGLRSPRRLAHALAAAVARDPVTAALLALMAAAIVLSSGWAIPVSPEHKLIDLGAGLLCVWLAVPIVRERRGRLLAAIGLYVVWVLVGALYGHAPTAGLLASLRNWLLLPILAVLLAARGVTEARARTVVIALFVLGAVEFVIAVVQLVVVRYATADPDLIVGSFGHSGQTGMSILILLISCIGIAGYLIGARYGTLALAGAMLLPVFSAWGVAKLATLALPPLALLIGVAALVGGKTTRRPVITVVVAALVSSGLVVAAYAISQPGRFQSLTSTQQFSQYVNAGTTTSGGQGRFALPKGRSVAYLHGIGVATFPAGVMYRYPIAGLGYKTLTVRNSSSRSFGAFVESPRLGIFVVQSGRTYRFDARLAAGQGVTTLGGGVAWFGRAATLPSWVREPHLIEVDVTRPAPVDGGSRSALGAVRRLDLKVVAPPGAYYAFPYLRTERAGARTGAIHIGSVMFGTSSPTSAQGEAASGPVTKYPGRVASPWFPIVPRLTGHFTLLHMAASAISGGLGSALFGKGLGTASPQAVTRNGGGKENLLPNAAAGGAYSDAGTLLVERGWTGLLLVVVAGLALVALAVRLVRTLPAGRWATALTLAVPGAIAVIVVFGLRGTAGLQTLGPALVFWVILALGMSPLLRRRRPD